MDETAAQAERRQRQVTATVTALIPAHNEADQIAAAIACIHAQTRAVDKIVVLADNCTDNTEAIAAKCGAEVFRTRGNSDKKAGALNQYLNQYLPGAGDDDQILVIDADSYLDRGFTEVAAHWLARGYGGIGGTFRGRRDPHGRSRRFLSWWVETVQCNEYARYDRDVRRKRGRILVLTGTATLFSVRALRAVVAARRAGHLPCGPRPEVYDTSVLTEDNELTLALLHLGWKVRSPRGCTLSTEVMPSWRDLYMQRLRWKRGAMENLGQYGLTKVTAKYWGYQLITLLGMLVTSIYLSTIVYSLVTGSHTLRLHLLWLAVTAIFVTERVVTVRARGWRQMLFAACLLPEMVFDIFLQATHAKALADSLLGTSKSW